LIAEFTNGAGVMSAGGTPQQYNDIIGPDILRYPDVKVSTLKPLYSFNHFVIGQAVL
jgi:hypothetical protein